MRHLQILADRQEKLQGICDTMEFVGTLGAAAVSATWRGLRAGGAFVAKSEGELSWRCHSEEKRDRCESVGGGGRGRG